MYFRISMYSKRVWHSSLLRPSFFKDNGQACCGLSYQIWLDNVQNIINIFTVTCLNASLILRAKHPRLDKYFWLEKQVLLLNVYKRKYVFCRQSLYYYLWRICGRQMIHVEETFQAVLGEHMLLWYFVNSSGYIVSNGGVTGKDV